jgi:hypothetical protein
MTTTPMEQQTSLLEGDCPDEWVQGQLALLTAVEHLFPHHQQQQEQQQHHQQLQQPQQQELDRLLAVVEGLIARTTVLHNAILHEVGPGALGTLERAGQRNQALANAGRAIHYPLPPQFRGIHVSFRILQ